MPPLRERKEDIPLLTRHFIEKYAREFGKEVRTISSYAMELLMEYPFPEISANWKTSSTGVAMETSNIILPENLALAADADTPGGPTELPLPDTASI
jgi:two-component system response regulator PilR (NtrC family)